MKKILVTGVGGQGVVLLSKLISTAYVEKGYFIKTTETIGMAQMGGSVTSHIRAGKKNIHSPIIKEGKAQIIFGFEPSEVLRNFKYLNEETSIILCKTGVKPITDSLYDLNYEPEKVVDLLKNKFKNVYSYNFKEFFEEIGTDKPMNLALLGVAMGLGLLGIGEEEMIHTIKTNISHKFLKINLLAYDYGLNLGKKKGEKNE